MRRCSSLALVAVLVAACSGPNEPTPVLDANYVVSAGLLSPGGINSYVGLVPSITDDVELDESNSIEVVGLALLYPQPGTSTFYVDSLADLTLTKYAVEDGLPVEKGVLNFSNLGFPTTGRTSGNVFAADDRAYLVESGTRQLVDWNPSEMTITNTTVIEGLDNDVADNELLFVYAPVVRDGEAYFPVSVSNNEDDIIAPLGMVLIVDLDDGATTVLRDEGCGDAIYPVLTERGDIYFGSGTVNAAQEHLNREGVGAACVRKIPAGSKSFDTSFTKPIASYVDGDIAGGLVAGPDGDAWVRVLNTDFLGLAVAGNSSLAVSLPAWSWWRIDLEDGTGTRLDLPESAGRFTAFTVDGETFTTVSTADFGSTTLYSTSSNTPQPGLVMRGITSGIGRLVQ